MRQYDKSKELYRWCIDTLVAAYMNNSMRAGNPCDCGVGTIALARYRAINGGATASDRIVVEKWAGVFSTSNIQIPPIWTTHHVIRSNGKYKQYMLKPGNQSDGQQVLKIIPIPVDVLMNMEWAFETNQIGLHQKDRTLNGLCALIEVLSAYFEVNGQEDIQALRSHRQVENLERQLETILSLPSPLNTEEHDRSSNTCEASPSQSLAHQIDS